MTSVHSTSPAQPAGHVHRATREAQPVPPGGHAFEDFLAADRAATDALVREAVDDYRSLFPGRRSSGPAGYVNATPPAEQARLDAAKKAEFTQALSTRLTEAGVDPQTSFDFRMGVNGHVEVVGDHPDEAKIEEILNSDRELHQRLSDVMRAAARTAIEAADAWALAQIDGGADASDTLEATDDLVAEAHIRQRSATFAGGELTLGAETVTDRLPVWYDPEEPAGEPPLGPVMGAPEDPSAPVESSPGQGEESPEAPGSISESAAAPSAEDPESIVESTTLLDPLAAQRLAAQVADQVASASLLLAEQEV